MESPPEFLFSLRFSLAEITGWFNWEALGAIGTVGALWFVVIQSTRAARVDRAKAIGILTFLIGLVEPVEIVSIHEEYGADQLKDAPSDLIDSDLRIVRRALRGIEILPLTDASSVGVVEWVMALPLALKDIEAAPVSRKIASSSPVFSSMRYVQEANMHFRFERDMLRNGLLNKFRIGVARSVSKN